MQAHVQIHKHTQAVRGVACIKRVLTLAAAFKARQTGMGEKKKKNQLKREEIWSGRGEGRRKTGKLISLKLMFDANFLLNVKQFSLETCLTQREPRDRRENQNIIRTHIHIHIKATSVYIKMSHA